MKNYWWKQTIPQKKTFLFRQCITIINKSNSPGTQDDKRTTNICGD